MINNEENWAKKRKIKFKIFFDTIVIGIPIDELEELHPDLERDHYLKIYANKIRSKFKVWGINSIEIRNDNFKRIVLNISSDLLGKNSYRLISGETIFDLIDQINKSGVLKIKAIDFLQKVHVYGLHVTCDIKVENITPYLDILSISPTSKLCRSQKNIVKFYNYSESLPVKYTFYNKEKELTSPKSLKFFRHVKSTPHNSNSKNVIRFETKLMNFKSIRKYLGIDRYKKPIFISDILSKDSPYLNFFDEIFSAAPNKKLLEEYGKQSTLKKVINNLAVEKLSELCNSKSFDVLLKCLTNLSGGDKKRCKNFLYSVQKYEDSINTIDYFDKFRQKITGIS